MIIGRGDIGSLLLKEGKDRDDRVYFASGVSNSQETRESEYQREKDLLLEQDKSMHLIYFGSLSVFYENNRYAQHKKEMEDLVKKEFHMQTIIRLGNITWGNNPNTLINFLRNRVTEGKSVQLRNVTRYVVDKKEFLHWIDMIPQGWNCEMNLTGQSMTVTEIFKKYVI